MELSARKPRARGRVSAAVTATATVLLAGIISSCSSLGATANSPIIDSTWQVTNIYIDPEGPSGIPPALSGVPRLSFSQHSLAGYTGCAPLQGQVNFVDDEGDSAPADQASQIVLDDVVVDEVDTDCSGPSAWAHSNLTDLLTTGARFNLETVSNHELLLRSVDDKPIDSPSIRLTVI